MQNLSEKRLAKMLDDLYRSGTISELEVAGRLEEFRTKRKASTYALYSAIAARRAEF
jgi:hypothetical protein